ncbi:MAG: GH32 C-terminal domain-containing protein, partial [Eubacteriales bacterium]|nr:GH32 C-terminal domain-containing protein [Eubacteriales bacterium]
RDPKISRTETGYRAIVASKGAQGGQLLRFDSDDLHHWRYTGVFSEGLAEMSECPDCFPLDGRDVLIVCVMNAKEANLPDAQTVLYGLGSERDGRFAAETERRALDWGLDFYAPQTTLTRDGRRVLMGWALSWRDVAPTHTLGHGWAGMMTVPRECRIRGDRLCQQPLRELETLREHPSTLSLSELSGRVQWPEAAGAHKELRIAADISQAQRFAVHLMETGDERFAIVYENGMLRVERAACGYSLGENADTCRKTAVDAPNGELRLHILVDVSIVEIFVGNGETVMTSLAFPREEGYGVSLEVEGKARVSAECWDVRAEIMRG